MNQASLDHISSVVATLVPTAPETDLANALLYEMCKNYFTRRSVPDELIQAWDGLNGPPNVLQLAQAVRTGEIQPTPPLMPSGNVCP